MQTEYVKLFCLLKTCQTIWSEHRWMIPLHSFVWFKCLLELLLLSYGAAFCELKDQSLLVLKFPSVLKENNWSADLELLSKFQLLFVDQTFVWRNDMLTLVNFVVCITVNQRYCTESPQDSPNQTLKFCKHNLHANDKRT